MLYEHHSISLVLMVQLSCTLEHICALRPTRPLPRSIMLHESCIQKSKSFNRQISCSIYLWTRQHNYHILQHYYRHENLKCLFLMHQSLKHFFMFSKILKVSSECHMNFSHTHNFENLNNSRSCIFHNFEKFTFYNFSTFSRITFYQKLRSLYFMRNAKVAFLDLFCMRTCISCMRIEHF